MSKKTREERFVLALYDLAKSKGNVEVPVLIAAVGREVGITRVQSAVTMAKTLLRSNFVSRLGKDEICLTSHGLELVQRLRGDR